MGDECFPKKYYTESGWPLFDFGVCSFELANVDAPRGNILLASLSGHICTDPE
jgi:hypothetical protein